MLWRKGTEKYLGLSVGDLTRQSASVRRREGPALTSADAGVFGEIRESRYSHRPRPKLLVIISATYPVLKTRKYAKRTLDNRGPACKLLLDDPLLK
jgi:hypothetical protein